MSKHNTYLTDEKLEQLIADVEANEMVSAPPDMLEAVLNEIGIIKVHNKKKEFQLYCFRVISSVAAAILLLFVIPEVSKIQMKLSEVMQETIGAEGVPKEPIAPHYATKQEALNDRGILGSAFGNDMLFGEHRDLGIFK